MPILMIDIGHLHPLFVHLPIGIMVFAFILEIIHRKKPSGIGSDYVRYALGATALSALVSLGTGWLLGNDGAYDETLLFRHRWLAVAFTTCSVLLFLLKSSKNTIAIKIYPPLFIVVMVLLSITGHLGGSMTHGENYLLKVPEAKAVVIEDVNEAMVYNDIIRPILQRNCISCHNPNKVKGGLLMTSEKELLKGGDSGSILDSSSTGSPILLKRLHLPIADEEHMPPKGKIQPTANEIALLEWWLKNNHCFDCLTKNLVQTEDIATILTTLEADTSLRYQIAQKMDKVPLDWLVSLNQGGISTYPLAKDSPLIIVNLTDRKDLSKKDIKQLKKYAKNIVELNLGGSNFNDTLSTLLPLFKNLTKLQLQNSSITDRTVKNIADLEYLESLNLYGTRVTDNSLQSIDKLTNLKNLYIWKTDITANAISKFDQDHPAVAIQLIDDDVFAETSLMPPTIVAETDFFRDSLQVSLEYAFDDAVLYYTLNGKEPDTSSIRYTSPFVLTESALIKAFTYKKGWERSDTSTANLKKSVVDYNAISLNKPPNEKYKGKGAKTLVDLKRGTDNFVDGNWLGYEGSHFTTTLDLKQSREISSISVGALSAPTNWIFFPIGFKVWTSQDGNNYSLVNNTKLLPQEPTGSIERTFFDLEIPTTKTKYVRVEIRSPLKNPEWHEQPGGKSWIFIDEIVLN